MMSNLHPLQAQRDQLLAALNGLIGLVQLVDSRGDMPIVLADNHRYIDALALVKHIEGGRTVTFTEDSKSDQRGRP